MKHVIEMKTQPIELLRAELIKRYDNNEFDAEYADYIIEHSAGDRVICNGDTLIEAIEDMYLFEEFIDSLIIART